MLLQGMRGRRGVVFTIDLIVALFFFLVIVISMLWLWGEAYNHMNEYMELNARHKRLMDISSMLVKTQGNPMDWHEIETKTPDNVHSLGLASQGNVLDYDKLDAMIAIDYQDLRNIMGFGVEDFRITVAENFSGTPVILYTKGTEQATSEIMVVKRYALLNGTRVELKLETYYNKK